MLLRRASFVIGLALTLLAVSLSITRQARANGRFPQAQAIVAAPGSDGTKIFMRTTFGILVSADAGASWRWICERALGYEGQWDPPIAVTRDGTLWVGLQRGVVSTRDDGCSVDPSPELAGETIKDLTVDGRGDTIFAIAGRPDKPSSVWRKRPGAKWERLAAQGLEQLNLLTIEVAPSRPSRLYVSGEPYDTIRGRLYVSDDGGRSFTGKENDMAPDGPFFIAGVDPTAPDRVLVRHLHGQGSAVLLTTDAGKSFRSVLSMKSAMFGFAKSEGGRVYWAGSGLPKDGLFRSTDRGEHFEPVASRGVLCLHATEGRLFACENTVGGAAPFVSLSVDEGKTAKPLARFADVAGPLACTDAGARDAGGSLCAAAWPEIRAFLLPRGEGDAAAGPAYADSGPRDADHDPHSAPRRSACGCRAAGLGAGQDPRWLTPGLAPLLLWGWHRKRRGSRPAQVGPP